MTPTTIFAPATAPGRAGVAVIRVSGPGAGPAVAALAGRLPAPRHATLATLRDPASGEVLDRGLVLWFPAPHSFTGEDVAEFHIHGGRAVTAGLMEGLGRLSDLRPAEPGEFARRAFDNGRLDLTEAEAIADLVGAETAAQRRQALRQMGGELGRLYEGWRERLLRALAHLEAELDFADEDLPEVLGAAAAADLAALGRAIAAHLDDGRRGERLRDGIQIAILGPPNAGKSRLLNRLARRDVAIVSERAGTTRDVIEVHLDLGGLPVILADTAGLREPGDDIEGEGVRRTRLRAAEADLRLLVFDIRDWPRLDRATLALAGAESVVVLNKADLAGGALPDAPAPLPGRPMLALSARTGQGVPDLLAWLERWAGERLSGAAGPALTRERHRQALVACRTALDRAAVAVLPELAAEDIRLAVRALGRITGRVDVEDVLDAIFQEFCIGK